MRVGDIVVSVDGKRVETVNGLIDLVQAKDKGAKVKIEVLRDGKAVKFEVEVAEEESGGLARIRRACGASSSRGRATPTPSRTSSGDWTRKETR
ncbi:MAG: PDZ domain-containing protein [Candidatus Moduliflexus flocculans]|nr:PDZ domain-containing protein [Candidatus Moduliflexus flocculans]